MSQGRTHKSLERIHKGFFPAAIIAIEINLGGGLRSPRALLVYDTIIMHIIQSNFSPVKSEAMDLKLQGIDTMGLDW